MCGTHSFLPKCRLFQINENNYTLEGEKTGQALCPYDPQHNSTAVFVGKNFLILILKKCNVFFAFLFFLFFLYNLIKIISVLISFLDNELYTGTVADFSSSDPIIYREPLQTEQYDSLSLNAPNFVGSFSQGDFVYFFFRETAVEYINCGKAVFSRVARVCKWDKGGPHRFRNRWTSYLKSRLNCSLPGDFPFYFNEIRKYHTVSHSLYII